MIRELKELLFIYSFFSGSTVHGNEQTDGTTNSSDYVGCFIR